ncbi:MAG: DUF3299 domain-containing protein [Alphaproteobacteria bacterium]|nr:DUF3299 domain-containing protein [Alphaproteobacteria bacterium]
MFRLLSILLVAWTVWAVPASAAETAPTLTWDDLIPKGADYPPDPLNRLTETQRDDLGLIFRVRQAAAGAGLGDDSDLVQEAEERTAELKRAGVDIEGLLAEVRAWEEERDRVDRMIATDLDGKVVRIPGYILPLEYEGSKVTQFLLVPYVGACIHVPPPPANQIVHVRSKEGLLDAGIFTPVYVTGKMSAEGVSSRSLFLTDGEVNVSFGYALQGATVEPYRK